MHNLYTTENEKQFELFRFPVFSYSCGLHVNTVVVLSMPKLSYNLNCFVVIPELVDLP